MLKEIKCPQLAPRMIGFYLAGASGTPVLGEGQFQASEVDNGVGDYSLTFVNHFHRAPVVVATPKTADVIVRIAAVSITAVQVQCFDATDGTTPKEADLHIMVLGFDSADEY